MKLLLFLITQSTIFQFWTPAIFRGYGCGTPNGALWTIGVIVQAYIVLFFYQRILHRKPHLTWLIHILLWTLISVLITNMGRIVPEIIFKLVNQTFIPYFWIFISGAFVMENNELILPIVKKYWIIFLAISLLLMRTKIDINVESYGVLRHLFLNFGLLGFAYRFPALNIKIDISYSLYLYHMIIINLMIQFDFVREPIYLVVAIIWSCIVALLSTLTVGKIANKIKVNQAQT